MGCLTSAVPMGSPSTLPSVDEVVRSDEVHHCVTLSSSSGVSPITLLTVHACQ